MNMTIFELDANDSLWVSKVKIEEMSMEKYG